eukprot:TRINITY_DN7641_c0_g1_i1.p1 TRINITY_DN7641_c0_g1~~TRINITY_DN7641_c0_g1_i1.p1  ORF type:complete len:573 (-),score=136.58 TRINITY_DN7641_c0_g1_i1:221-1939(-)
MATLESSGDINTWKPISLGGKRANVMGVLKMNKDGIAWRSKGGQSITVVGSDLRSGQWQRLSRIFQLRLFVKGGVSYKFVGFREQDGDFMKTFFLQHFRVKLEDMELTTTGWNWGETDFDDNNTNVRFKVDSKVAFELPLSEVLQCSVPSKKSNEVLLKFHQDDTSADVAESLVEMRWHFPVSSEGGEEKEANSKATRFMEEVLKGIDRTLASGKGILTFEQVPVLVPRGRYDIEMFATFMEMHGLSCDYKIKYSSIVRLFQLPRPDRQNVIFIISLEPPIRQGQTNYPHVVMQIEEESEMNPSPIIPEDMKNDPRMKQLAALKPGAVYSVIARAMRTLTEKKIVPPKSFKSKSGGRAVKCSLRANEGYLYPLEKEFFFVHKPPTHITHEEIVNVEFMRVSSDNTNRTFDIQMNLDNGTNLAFKSIPRGEYEPLATFMQAKDIKITNFEGNVGISLSEDEEIQRKEGRVKRQSAPDRSRLARALQAEKIDESEESDHDFGGELSSDDEVSSGEIDSASEDQVAGLVEENLESSKKRKKEEEGDTNGDEKLKRRKGERGEVADKVQNGQNSFN